MKKQIIFIIVLALFAGLTTSIQAAEKHPIGKEDMAALRSARPVALSPDGETILYEVAFGGTKGRTNHDALMKENHIVYAYVDSKGEVILKCIQY